MSDTEEIEGSPLEEQPGSPEEEVEEEEEEEQEDLTTETNGDHPDESENADQEEGSRKRSLSTSEEKNDDSPSKKVAKEEISLAIICDSHAKNLEKIKQTETAIIFHLKVKIAEELSVDTIPTAVEEVLSEDPETKCVVIILPQDDLVQSAIPLSCQMNGCSGKGLQHTMPIPVISLSTYMDKLKRMREELLETYPDTEFYWLTPGPIDFKHLNRKAMEKKHHHTQTTDSMWTSMVANYIKRLRVIYEEIPGKMAVSWFTRACWLNNRGKYSQGSQSSLHQRLLQGDLGPVHAAQLISEGENLTVKGGQAMWMTIRKKIHWYRKTQAIEKAKTETEKEEDPSGNTEDDLKDGEEVNGKAEEDPSTENDLNDGHKKKSVVKTTIIGDTWIQILSDIERWQAENWNRKNVKVYQDLSIDSVTEFVDQVLSEETDTENLVLSVFQNTIISGLSAENIENESIPCVYSTIEDLLEKASNIEKYVKKTYPKVKLFWVGPGPVGYYNEEDKKEEEKMEVDSDEQEKDGKKKEETEKKDEDKTDEDKVEDEDKEDEGKAEDEEKAENEEKAEDNEEKETNEIEIEEEEKEEDPEIRKLRRACSSSNTIAMVLSKRLAARFNKQVVNWFEVFNSNWNGVKNIINAEHEGKILEGKVVKHRYLEEDFVNLSEFGGNKLTELINRAVSGDKPRNRLSNDHGSQGINKRLGNMGGRVDGDRGRGRGRGRGGRKDGGMGARPIDKRLSWDGRGGGGGQHDPWGQQGGGNWKGRQQRREPIGHDMRDVINRERATNNYSRRGGNWGGQYVDPWARNDYGGYYGQRY